MTRLFIFYGMLAFSSAVSAQDFSFGFKTGLNFSNIKGDVEKTADAIETLDRNIGFHFGATFAYGITDLMGLRGEFMYSQKGTKRSFVGQSYYNFITSDNEFIRTTGLRKQELNVNNSYLEVPVMFYFRPHSRFEVYAGASAGLLVSSSAFGNLSYSGIKDDSGLNVSDINHELDFNYLSDKAGEFTIGSPASTVKINGDNVPYPQTAGAYFEFIEDRGKLYRPLDLGLVGGVSVYLSKSLYVSGRLNYGLVDITKTRADVSLSTLTENDDFISRDDDDRNFSIQASVGFSF